MAMVILSPSVSRFSVSRMRDFKKSNWIKMNPNPSLLISLHRIDWTTVCHFDYQLLVIHCLIFSIFTTPQGHQCLMNKPLVQFKSQTICLFVPSGTFLSRPLIGHVVTWSVPGLSLVPPPSPLPPNLFFLDPFPIKKSDLLKKTNGPDHKVLFLEPQVQYQHKTPNVII